MKGVRPFVHCALISFPTIVLCAAGIYFLLNEVPRIARNERAAITREYRRIAKKILTRTEAEFDYVGPREKRGWRMTGRIDGQKWGVTESAQGRLVWVEKDGIARGIRVDARDGIDYERLLTVGVVSALAVLIVLTFVCVRFFLRYARMRDDFLAAAAHDLTTPLAGMRYLIGSDDESAKALNERLIRIVANIRDFLQCGGKRRKPQLSTFDLRRAYEEAYRLFRDDYRDAFDGADVAFEVAGADAAEAWLVRADETMTVQILWNLLGNDLKYAAPYGKVRARMERDGPFVLFSLIDEGPGMTARQMRKAFNRYYRARTVLRTGKGGFGIGLCTAREFAKAMGGGLSVRKNRPAGCRFELRLKGCSL